MVGLRGARAAQAKPRTCFGRRRGAKNEKMKSLEIVAMALVVVVGILSECVIAFVNPFVSPLPILCGPFPPPQPPYHPKGGLIGICVCIYVCIYCHVM